MVAPIENCIGRSNEDKIRELELKYKELYSKLEWISKEKVSNDSLHKLEKDMITLTSSIKEMKNNREEDRLAISKLSNSVEELSTRLEEYLEVNAKLLAGQIVTDNRTENIESAIEKLALSMEKMNDKIEVEMERMNEKIEQANIMSQFKAFYGKSKFNKWIMRFAVVLLVIFIVAVFTFFFDGGQTSFFDILRSLKELIV